MAINNFVTGLLIAVVGTAAIIAGVLINTPTSFGPQTNDAGSEVQLPR